MSDVISIACEHLRNGDVVCIPTETVYGLAADATNDAAVAGIYAIKNRPSFNPLILHVSNAARAFEIGKLTGRSADLASFFWAAKNHRPLTLVVPIWVESNISKLATAGLSTVGVRVPNHPVTNELLGVYPNPLAAPSANLSTQISATNAGIVRASLGDKVPYILDGGQCVVGVESTIIDTSVEPYKVLRFGGTSIEEIAKILGYTPQAASIFESIKAPGMMKRHYAPSIPLFMDQLITIEGDAFLGFGTCGFGEYNLSKSGDLTEAAANLFRLLFELDDPQRFNAIRVAPIPSHGLGAAINDRLKRASQTQNGTATRGV
jgi:L-threonylcarbamoyladenylate synthase